MTNELYILMYIISLIVLYKLIKGVINFYKMVKSHQKALEVHKIEIEKLIKTQYDMNKERITDVKNIKNIRLDLGKVMRLLKLKKD